MVRPVASRRRRYGVRGRSRRSGSCCDSSLFAGGPALLRLRLLQSPRDGVCFDGTDRFRRALEGGALAIGLRNDLDQHHATVVRDADHAIRLAVAPGGKGRGDLLAIGDSGYVRGEPHLHRFHKNRRPSLESDVGPRFAVDALLPPHLPRIWRKGHCREHVSGCFE